MLGSLRMTWRHVLFANWPGAPDVGAPHLPAGVDLDTYDGEAWLSVVPFTNVDVRPAWLPAGLGGRLPELNLRTYVVHDGHPGVYFLSLDAQGVLGVVGARVVHHLPYYYARIDLDVADGLVRFRSRRTHPGARPARFAATYGPTDDRPDTGPGSLAAFLVERSRYYTEAPSGALRYGSVRHEPWPVARADARIARNTLFRANGVDAPPGDPVCYSSPGVDTLASRNRPV